MEVGTKLCVNGSKGYEDILSVEYQVKETVLLVLLTIMLFGGILTILSNSLVLVFGLTRKNLFPSEILSLAVTDFLTGVLGTPSVMAIYYFSEFIFLLHMNDIAMLYSQRTPDWKATFVPIK